VSPSGSSVNGKIPVPPPFHDQNKMLPRLSPPTKDSRIEMDTIGGNVSGYLLDLAEDESDDRARAPAKKQGGTIQPAPT
jgi:hypothetical protein